MATEKSIQISSDETVKKLKIVEGLFNLAYALKTTRLRELYPEISQQEIHNRVLELIERGCR